MKRINSRDNRQYRHLLRLVRSSKERHSSGQMLLDGLHLIQSYVDAFGSTGMLLVVRSSAVEAAHRVSKLHVDGDPDTVVLSDALFNQISPVDTSPGLLAVAPIPETGAKSFAAAGFTVFVDGVQDPGNLGAILRSAAAAGGAAVLLSPQCADPWSPRCLRGGMGGHFRIRLEHRVDLVQAASRFEGRLVAADSRGDQSLFEADLGDKVGFLVGGEGQGISLALLNLAGARVQIPMAPGIESLNAAAAATLLFYEWRRRRTGESPQPEVRTPPGSVKTAWKSAR